LIRREVAFACIWAQINKSSLLTSSFSSFYICSNLIANSCFLFWKCCWDILLLGFKCYSSGNCC
jgi:hypothetical protein